MIRSGPDRRGPIRRARHPLEPGGGLRGLLVLAGVAVLLMGAGRWEGRPERPGDTSARPGARVLPSPGPPSRTAAEPDPVTVVAAGDIACPPGRPRTRTQCRHRDTSDLALALRPDAVLPLGDNAYETGSAREFRLAYRPTWGRLDRIARPVPGNHEYGYTGGTGIPNGAAGYFGYFRGRANPSQPGCRSRCDSWYSWDLGAWHFVALDSQCDEIGGCDPGSRQYEWLRADLAGHPSHCLLAYWHIPVFASSQDRQPDMEAIYALLDRAGADVVLNGHGHFYERFAPQDARGAADPKGITQFVVGTGGRSFFEVDATPAANSRELITDTFGVLRLRLSAQGYRWAFVSIGTGERAVGEIRDQGVERCR